jgi:hypothetical protein
MKMRVRLLLLLPIAAILALSLASFACGGDDDEGEGAEATNDVTAGICAEDAEDCDDTVDNGENPDEPVNNDVETSPAPAPCADDTECAARSEEIAVRDLSAQLGVETGTIAVVSTEAVQWPDACMGAAQPGTACAEVITPGFKIILSHGNTTYEYHTDRGTRAVLLEQP